MPHVPRGTVGPLRGARRGRQRRPRRGRTRRVTQSRRSRRLHTPARVPAARPCCFDRRAGLLAPWPTHPHGRLRRCERVRRRPAGLPLECARTRVQRPLFPDGGGGGPPARRRATVFWHRFSTFDTHVMQGGTVSPRRISIFTGRRVVRGALVLAVHRALGLRL